MASYTIPLSVLAFLLAHAVPVLFAIPAGLLLLALILHIYLRRPRRRRLAAFISTINGQIEIPGACREFKLRSLSRRKG